MVGMQYGRLVTSGLRTFSMPKTWIQADEILGKREEKKIGNNTLLVRRGPRIALRLHRTDVVTFLKNGTRILESNGWQTPTTRDRMRAAGVPIYMHSGIACVAGVAYLDGMRLLADGTTLGGGKPIAEAVKARRAALRRHDTQCWPGKQGGWMPHGNAPEAR